MSSAAWTCVNPADLRRALRAAGEKAGGIVKPFLAAGQKSAHHHNRQGTPAASDRAVGRVSAGLHHRRANPSGQASQSTPRACGCANCGLDGWSLGVFVYVYSGNNDRVALACIFTDGAANDLRCFFTSVLRPDRVFPRRVLIAQNNVGSRFFENVHDFSFLPQYPRRGGFVESMTVY